MVQTWWCGFDRTLHLPGVQSFSIYDEGAEQEKQFQRAFWVSERWEATGRSGGQDAVSPRVVHSFFLCFNQESAMSYFI